MTERSWNTGFFPNPGRRRGLRDNGPVRRVQQAALECGENRTIRRGNHESFSQFALCCHRSRCLRGLAPLAAAQTGAASIIEEIVVTARKRDDNLQDVPLSVTAFTGDQLQRRQFRDLQDIAQETSGLVYEDYATAGLSTAAVIRSMGQTFTTARVQNTAVFLDGVYLQRQSMINPGLMDLERVEVVKGPQNAQFGRNAFSGVVHYISRKPSDELSGNLTATYGDGDRLDLRGSASVPLIEDKMFLRLAGGISEYDGHTRTTTPSPTMARAVPGAPMTGSAAGMTSSTAPLCAGPPPTNWKSAPATTRPSRFANRRRFTISMVRATPMTRPSSPAPRPSVSWRRWGPIA